MTTQLSDILLGQWQESPRISGIVDDVLQPLLDDTNTAAGRIQLMQDIDEAEGIWLDILGAKMGIRRPATTDPVLDTRFGFHGVGAHFGAAPFRGAMSNDALFPLSDAVFRLFVKARAITVLGDGTVQTLAKAVRVIDPTATVVDNRDMTVTVTTGIRATLELSDSIAALPRNAGVNIVYA